MATGRGEDKIKLDSSVIEMQMVDDEDLSDYDTPFDGSDGVKERKNAQDAEVNPADEMKKQIGQNVSQYVWQTGAQQAKKAFSVYANIDILRPYFDVEPHEVRTRLIQSLIPVKPGSSRQRVAGELYGPLMVVFTLIAILLFQMKTSGHRVEEGTLMGTAFGVCFGYWFGVAAFTWFLAYVCNSHIRLLQLLSLLGYALFGHCVVLFLGTMIHTSHDHMFFYLCWAVFGGLSTLKIISVMVTRTHGPTQRLIVCGFVAAAHLLFLLYLHFAYHQIVEELSDAMNQNFAPQKSVVDPDKRGFIMNPVTQAAKVLADNVASHMKPTLPDGPQEPAADSVQRIVRQAVVKVADSLNSTSSSSSALSQASLAQKMLNNTIYGATH